MVVGTALERVLVGSTVVAQTCRRSQDTMHADPGTDGIIFAVLVAELIMS